MKIVGIFYANFVIWWQFGMLPPVLVYQIKKNLATPVSIDKPREVN
jgi:hypothetical protein